MTELHKSVLALMLSMRAMDTLARKRVLKAIKDEYLYDMDDVVCRYPGDVLWECVHEEYNRRINLE